MDNDPDFFACDPGKCDGGFGISSAAEEEAEAEVEAEVQVKEAEVKEEVDTQQQQQLSTTRTKSTYEIHLPIVDDQGKPTDPGVPTARRQVPIDVDGNVDDVLTQARQLFDTGQVDLILSGTSTPAIPATTATAGRFVLYKTVFIEDPRTSLVPPIDAFNIGQNDTLTTTPRYLVPVHDLGSRAFTTDLPTTSARLDLLPLKAIVSVVVEMPDKNDETQAIFGMDMTKAVLPLNPGPGQQPSTMHKYLVGKMMMWFRRGETRIKTSDVLYFGMTTNADPNVKVICSVDRKGNLDIRAAALPTFATRRLPDEMIRITVRPIPAWDKPTLWLSGSMAAAVLLGGGMYVHRIYSATNNLHEQLRTCEPTAEISATIGTQYNILRRKVPISKKVIFVVTFLIIFFSVLAAVHDRLWLIGVPVVLLLLPFNYLKNTRGLPTLNDIPFKDKVPSALFVFAILLSVAFSVLLLVHERWWAIGLPIIIFLLLIYNRNNKGIRLGLIFGILGLILGILTLALESEIWPRIGLVIICMLVLLDAAVNRKSVT
jgi:hypothetical protein